MKLSKELNKLITKVVITHPHQDHVAGLDAIVDELGDIDVYISQRDSLLLKGDFSIYDKEENRKIRGGFSKVNTIPNKLVSDGDYIGSLRVISTSGHTPGSISLYNENTGSLFVDDLLQIRGGLAVAGDTRWSFPFPAMATWSIEKSIESTKKIAELKISSLATGHGDVLTSPVNELLKAISKAEKRLENEKKKNR